MFKRSSLWAIVLIGLTAWVPAYADSTFEEQSGGFTIDLPDEYQLKAREYKGLYIFVGDAPRITAVFTKGAVDLDVTYDSAMAYFDKLLTDMKAMEFATLEVNGKPAKWGLYRGMGESNGTKVPIYAYVISVILDNGSLMLFATMHEGWRDKWGDAVKKSFRSVREVGTPVTGVRNVKPAG